MPEISWPSLTAREILLSFAQDSIIEDLPDIAAMLWDAAYAKSTQENYDIIHEDWEKFIKSSFRIDFDFQTVKVSKVDLAIALYAASLYPLASSTVYTRISAVKLWMIEHCFAGIELLTEQRALPFTHRIMQGYRKLRPKSLDSRDPLLLPLLPNPATVETVDLKIAQMITVQWHGAMRTSTLIQLRFRQIELLLKPGGRVRLTINTVREIIKNWKSS